MRFIQTARFGANEHVNANNVVRLFLSSSRDTFAELRDGRTIELGYSIDQMVKALCPVIPAHPGFELLEAYSAGDHADGAVDGFWWHRSPIIAWRITERGVEPVTVDNDDVWGDDTEHFCAVKYPDGQVCVLIEATFKNEEQWRDSVKVQFAERQKRKAAQTAKEASA